MLWSVIFLFVSIFAPATPFASFHLTDDLDRVSFEGVVTDQAQDAIPGATVTVKNQEGLGNRSSITGPDGGYRLTSLSPGKYEITIAATGFQTARYSGILAAAGSTIRRNIQLSPVAIENSIRIDASNDQSLVDVSRTVVGGTIVREQIDKLPTEARNPFELLYTLPGIASPALSDRELADGDRQDNFRKPPEETGILSLHGGTPFSNNLTIEGLDNNDDRGARERFIPSIDAVDEVQIITNQFSAEYGRASGGRVNLRLRGGTDRLRGQSFYFFRDESLNANSYVRNSDPGRGFRLPFQNHNPGGNLSGPIKRGKAYFFAAYEYDYIYDRAEISALLPVDINPVFQLPAPNGANLGSIGKDRNGKNIVVNGGAAVGLYDLAVTTPRTAHTLQSRLDLRLGDKHETFALLTIAKNNDERGFPGGRRTLDTLRRTGRDSRSAAFADNFIISSGLVNSVRFQFSHLAPADAPANSNPVILIDIDDPRDVTGNPNANPLTRRGVLTAGSSTISGVDRRENRYQFQDTLSFVRGGHTLRIGGDIQSIRSRYTDLSDATGTFTFAGPADFLAGRPARYEHRFNTESELRNLYTGIFVQEDWRLRPNINLSFGFRWDNESVLKDRNNFGPRISFAWDPFKTGKTVVRTGYGIFYNRALLRTLDDFIITSNTLRIDTDNEAAKQLLDQLKFPNVLAAGDPRVKSLGVKETGFVRRLSDGFRIPESYQASFGIEHEIGREVKIEINYVFNRGLHLWREINANAPRLPTGFSDFTAYLVSRDFDNRRDPITGLRPITNTGNADVVRFDLSQLSSRTIRENGKSIIFFGLNNQSTSNATSGLKAALSAIRNLRSNPDLTQVEELQSRGNSYYHGLSFEAQTRLTSRGFARASYTLSKLIDDGVVNTSSPFVVGDFRRERALSLLDVRHRIAVSGSYSFPQWLWRLNLSGTYNLSSSRPFNIGANGNDRNLDDVDNDRPNFSGDFKMIDWRRPGEILDQSLADRFTLPTIGSVGNLPRNAGRGPKSNSLNLRLSRVFQLGEHRKAEVQLEAFNPFNSTVLSFGAEYVDYSPSGLGDFLVPRRTMKARTMRIGIKFEF